MGERGEGRGGKRAAGGAEGIGGASPGLEIPDGEEREGRGGG